MDNHIALPMKQHRKTDQTHSLVEYVNELRVEEHGADVEQMWDYVEAEINLQSIKRVPHLCLLYLQYRSTA
jgi:hypothetical protein